MTDKEREALRKYIETVIKVEVAGATAALTDRIKALEEVGATQMIENRTRSISYQAKADR